MKSKSRGKGKPGRKSSDSLTDKATLAFNDQSSSRDGTRHVPLKRRKGRPTTFRSLKGGQDDLPCQRVDAETV